VARQEERRRGARGGNDTYRDHKESKKGEQEAMTGL